MCGLAPNGDEVALKCVSAPDPLARRGLLREIEALASLRHPGIVEILDHGDAAFGPWYAMPLVFGTPLAESQAHSDVQDTEWWTTSFRESTLDLTALFEDGPNPQVVAALTRVCKIAYALSYLHGEGLVHRDLKPANILVTPDDDPILVDFGLCGTFWGPGRREVLRRPFRRWGTPGFMAPEHLRGEVTDGRADLYALGCILFELATGHPVFAASTPKRLCRMHLVQRPPVPSRLEPRVPPELDLLVARLLAKDASRRVSHADDVIAAIEPILTRMGAEVPRRPPPAPKPYLYRPAYIEMGDSGRQLHRVLDDVEAGLGGVLRARGQAGAGKTRWAFQAAEAAASRGHLVFSVEAASDGRPLQSLRHLISDVARLCCAHPEVIGFLDPAVWAGLAIYNTDLAVVPGIAELPIGEPIPPRHLAVELATLLRRLATEGPVVVVVDEIDKADSASQTALTSLARDRKAGVVLISTVCAETSPNAEVEVELAPWEPTEIESLVRELLGVSTVRGDLIKAVVGRAAGSPLFVAELVFAAVSAGIIVRTPGGDWGLADGISSVELAATGLPTTLGDLLDVRAESLSAEETELYEAVAFASPLASPDVLAAVLEWSPTRVGRVSVGLTRRGVVVPSEEGELRPAHAADALRLASRIEATRRRQWHRRALQVLVERGERDRVVFASQRARHLEGAGRPAAKAWRAAADHAVTTGDMRTAEMCFRGALRTLRPEDGLTLHAVQRAFVSQVLLSIDTRAAEEMAMEALRGAERAGDPFEAARCQSLRAELAEVRGVEHRVTMELQLQAIDALERTQDEHWLVPLLCRHARLLGRLGRGEEALEVAKRGMQTAANVSAPGLQARAWRTIGILHRTLNDIGAARRPLERAVALADVAGSRKLARRTRMSLSLVSQQECDHIGARDRLLEVLEDAVRHGDRELEALCCCNLAISEDALGNPDPARRWIERAEAIGTSFGSSRVSNIVTVRRHLLLCHRGEFEQALTYADEVALKIQDSFTRGLLDASLLAAFHLGHIDRLRELVARKLEIGGEPGDAILVLALLDDLEGPHVDANPRVDALAGIVPTLNTWEARWAAGYALAAVVDSGSREAIDVFAEIAHRITGLSHAPLLLLVLPPLIKMHRLAGQPGRAGDLLALLGPLAERVGHPFARAYAEIEACYLCVDQPRRAGGHLGRAEALVEDIPGLTARSGLRRELRRVHRWLRGESDPSDLPPGFRL